MTVNLEDDSSDFDNAEYQFSTHNGLCLVRKVLQPLLLYDPHDDQLEGICKIINGIDLIHNASLVSRAAHIKRISDLLEH